MYIKIFIETSKCVNVDHACFTLSLSFVNAKLFAEKVLEKKRIILDIFSEFGLAVNNRIYAFIPCRAQVHLLKALMFENTIYRQL